MDRRRALMMAQGGAEPPFYINGYVGNGLEHYYDGIYNRGLDQPQATSGFPWVDLAGDRDIVLSDRGASDSWLVTSFSENGWNGTWNSFRSHFHLTDVQIPYPEFTISCRGKCRSETVKPFFGFFANVGDGSQKTLIVLVQSLSKIGIAYKGSGTWSGYEYKTFDWENNAVALSLTYKANDETMKLYADGTLLSEFEPVPTLSVFNKRYVPSITYLMLGGSQISNGIYFTDGFMTYGMVYNRVLTPDEIAINYQNDLVRFGA